MSKSFREEVIEDILTFSSKDCDAFGLIEDKYSSINKKNIVQELIQVGIMPEIFLHDSSEEKLWSKFSDVILSKALDYIGLESMVLRTRGNSADVFSKSKKYTIVSDAKCFRLSRTAKNQKDFKVKALDDWRRKDTYALLVSPLSQYPNDKSQIYSQALIHNVTLLSYLHLQFLVLYGIKNDLEELWNVSSYIQNNYKVSEQKRGFVYWESVDTLVSKITGKSVHLLNDYKKNEIFKTKELGEEGIRYWEGKINSIKTLSREEAIKLLIKSEKIEQKIFTIKKAIKHVYVGQKTK